MNLGQISALDPHGTGLLDVDVSMRITTNTANSGFFAGVLAGDPPPAPYVGTSGADTFALPSGFGDVTIANFDPAHDVVQFNAASFADFAGVMDHATAVGGNTVITAGPHDALTLQNVTPGQLHASDFRFA